MKIGIYINQRPDAGGGFYEALNSISKITDADFEFTYFTSNKACHKILTSRGIDTKFIRVSHFRRFILFLRYHFLLLAAKIIPGNSSTVKLIKKFVFTYNFFEKNFIKDNVDLIFFTSPDPNILYVENLNYCVSVWDMAHVEIPYYPELRRNFTVETRHFHYSRILPKAFAVLVGHERCRQSLINTYQIDAEKIFLVPFKASPFITKFAQQQREPEKSILTDINTTNYFYYPSQFAAHKNHYVLIKAFSIFLKQTGNSNFKIVFNGADTGNRDYLFGLCKNLKIENNVIFLPFQSDENVYALYKHSLAVLVPTHIGPATLPSLEALYLNKPLFLPDYRFNQEFYGKYGIYYDALSPEDLASRMIEFSAQKRTNNDSQLGIELYHRIQNQNDYSRLARRLDLLKMITSTFAKL